MFKGSTEKLKTRITYDSYAKPSTNFQNDIVADPELDLLDEEQNNHPVVHHNQRLFSSVEIDAYVVGAPYEPVQIQYSGPLVDIL